MLDWHYQIVFTLYISVVLQAKCERVMADGAITDSNRPSFANSAATAWPILGRCRRFYLPSVRSSSIFPPQLCLFYGGEDE